jgi:hypothetical protein
MLAASLGDVDAVNIGLRLPLRAAPGISMIFPGSCRARDVDALRNPG